ncbi:MAG: hypothetical protein RXO25_02215 [Caldivirga sp.]|jgi:hypothetical protein
MSSRPDDVAELIRSEFGEDSDLVLSLYKAYRERGVRGVREELSKMLGKYGVKV